MGCPFLMIIQCLPFYKDPNPKKVGILAWSIPSWSTKKIYKQIDEFKGDETKELLQSPKFLVIRSQNRVLPRPSFPIITYSMTSSSVRSAPVFLRRSFSIGLEIGYEIMAYSRGPPSLLER